MHPGREGPSQRRRGLALAVVGSCLLFACSEVRQADPPVRRLVEQPPVQPLDLNTLKARVEVSSWFKRQEGLWSALEGRASSTAAGLRLTADRNRHASIWRRLETAAGEIDTVIVHVTTRPPGPVQLYWAAPGETFTVGNSIKAEAIRGQASKFEIVFPVGQAPGWRHRIGRVRFTAILRSQAPELVVTDVQAVSQAADPRAIAVAAGLPRLIEIDREQRHGFVASCGVPLVWALQADAGDRLTFGFGAVGSNAGGVRFRVTSTPSGEVLFEKTVGAGGLAVDRWHDAAVELTPTTAGTELHFDCSMNANPGDRPSSAIPCWSAPEIADTGRPEVPNVLLVSIDTLRADHLSLYGYERPTSPRLDHWARRATVFETVVTTAPWTLPAHISMLTGLNAFQHGVNHRIRAPDSLDLVAEALRRTGYRTVAITGGGYLDPEFGLDQGFDIYRYWPERAGEEELRHGVSAALKWLNDGPREPWFLLFHTYEVHYPYRPRQPFFDRFTGGGADPDPASLAYVSEPRSSQDAFVLTKHWRRRTEGGHVRGLNVEERVLLRDLYDSGIAYADDQLAPLLEAADERNDTVVVVTSDHGEALGEQGLAGHAYLYDFNALVPLAIKMPGQRRSRRVEAQVRLTDIGPTILELAGVPPSDGIEGASLVPMMRGDRAAEDRDATTYASFSARGLALRLDRRWKYFHNNSVWPTIHGQSQLFDLRSDPEESTDVLAATRGVERLADRARDLTTSTQGALRMSFGNSSSRALRGLLGGSAANTARLRSPDLPVGAVRWEADRGIVLELSPASSFDLLLENPSGKGLRIELEPDLDLGVDLDSLDRPLERFLVDGGWVSAAPPHAEVEAHVVVDWGGLLGRSLDPAEEDAELREQLRALGYIE